MADFTKDPTYLSQSSSSMPNMDMDTSSTSMTMPMPMVFMTSTTTALYSASWAPTTLGQYAGTCIFLIILAFIFRFLLALKSITTASLTKKAAARNNSIIVAPASSDDDTDEKLVAVAPVGGEEKKDGWSGHPWRFSTELPRAGMAVVTTGLGYLL